MLGEIVGGVADIVGGNKASNVARRATRKAGGMIDSAYGDAIDLAKPIQETAAGDYQSLSDRYGAGEFRNPDQQKYQAGEFDYDPNEVFSDPEYQAQMRAGTQAIEGGAASKGGLFSGRTQMDLNKFGSDLFAGRSDELYNRNRSQYQDDRDFDYGAENRAYDANALNRSQDFSQGQTLASYAPGATQDMIDLGLGRGQAKADTELGVGQIRSNAIRGAFGKAGKLGQNAISKIPMGGEGSLY